MKSYFQTPFDIISKSVTAWHNGLKHSSAIEVARQRVMIVGCTILIAFLSVMIRLVDVMIFKQHDRAAIQNHIEFDVNRCDFLDRHGEVLATNIMTASAYVNAKQVINVDENVEKLSVVVKDLSKEEIRKRLSSKRNFVWVARHITPSLQQDINNLGIPGVYMYKDQTRIYPHGSLFSHTLGVCGIDGAGLTGMECFFDAKLQQEKNAIELSLDVRVQHILKNQLQASIDEFSAKGANAIVMKVKTGEILGMVSLPDFDPHDAGKSEKNSMFNRNTLGVYEPGSVFKILNVAIALESGRATEESIFDATNPVKIGKFTVSDFRGLGRPLSLREAFVKSSNIASIKISQQFGLTLQKEYLKKFGALEKLSLELPEIGGPLVPKNWTETSMMTISYGYGISQTPLQLLNIIAGIINHGIRQKPTLLKVNEDSFHGGERVISEKTSKKVRNLMRMVVSEGTGRKANVDRYDVFGKTGTAYQQGTKGYGSDKNRLRTTTFVGGFPVHDPEIIMVVMLDDPKATKETAGFATAGWNVAKCAGRIIEQIAPLYCEPNHGDQSNQTEDFELAQAPKIKSINHKSAE